MRILSGFIITSSAFLLVNCSTTNQGSPIYQQSTIYKGSAPQTATAPVMQAGYQTQVPAQITYAAQPVQPAQQASYTQINSACLGGGASNCAPTQIPANSQTAVITPAYQNGAYTQPYQRTVSFSSVTKSEPATQAIGIQETTDSLGDEGTPGYYAVNGYPEPELQQEQETFQAPVQPVYTAPVTQTSFAEIPTQQMDGNTAYTVQPGDNVYRLAINNCTSVEALKQINGINDQFYIRAGDQILLPAGNCAK